MAARVKLDMTADTDPEDIVTRLNHILFEQERFRGNRENYYDPWCAGCRTKLTN